MKVKVIEKNKGAELLSVILTKARENLESLGERGRAGNQISSFKEYGKMGQNMGVFSLEMEGSACMSVLPPCVLMKENKKLCFSLGKINLREGKKAGSPCIRCVLRDVMKEREFL